MKRAITATVAAVVMTTAAQAQTPAQPSGRDLFIKSLHVTGADTIMPKHKTMKMTGSLSIPDQGVSAPLENVRSAAGAFHLTVTVDGFGTVEQGYADSTAYSINPQTGPVITTGSAAAGAKRQALWLDSPDAYTSITNEGMAKFQNKDEWKVTMVSKDGLKMTRYFDPTTGYAVGTVMTTDVGMGGETEVTTVVSEYKNFGGLMFPSKQAQILAGTEQDIILDKIEFDTVPASAFELPAAIKALKK